MVERKSNTFDVTGSNSVSYKKLCALICGCGEIGRHARFRFWFARVRVQIPSPVLIAYWIQRRGLESPVTPAVGTSLEYEIWRLKLYSICAEIFTEFRMILFKYNKNHSI